MWERDSVIKKPWLFFCLLLLCAVARPVFSDDEGIEEEAASALSPEPESNVLIRGLAATGETMLTNVFLLGYNNILMRKYSWAAPNYDSVKGSLTREWQWEREDGFVYNQLGHPYQGSFYFNAGRVNGFGFYESVFFNMLGGSAWEVFGESWHASMNDFITTAVAPLSLGEILYRLYIEAVESGLPAPVAALINPMAGFHRLVTGWQPPKYGKRLYHLQIYNGASFIMTDYSTSEDWGENVSWYRGVMANTGISVVYGDPFLQESLTPYDHFEFDLHLGASPVYYANIRIFSDGYLVSFCPADTDKDMVSTGLSLHLDYVSQGENTVFYNIIDLYSNALDWTVKYKHLFSDNFSFQLKAHAGFTFMGASVYYSPYYDYHSTNNFGFGLNEKLNIIFDHKKFGKLDIRGLHYILWSYQNSRINDPSSGTANWVFADLSYSFYLTKNVSIGINGSFVWEWGVFSGFPGIRKAGREAGIFLSWHTD